MGIQAQPSFVQLCISCFRIYNLNEIAQFSSSLICTPAAEPQESLIINLSQGRPACMWKGVTGFGYSWFSHLASKFFFFLIFHFILHLYFLILGCLLDFPFLVACISVPRVIKVYAAADCRVAVILQWIHDILRIYFHYFRSCVYVYVQKSMSLWVHI